MDKFQQLAEEKKLRIINAALAEFSAKGYAAASTNAIAHQAGISKGSLFHYFGSKEKLWHWLLVYAKEIMEAALGESSGLESEDFIQSLTRASLVKLKVDQKYPALKSFFFRVSLDHGHEDNFLNPLIKEVQAYDQSAGLRKADLQKLRSDLTLEESLKVTCWVLEGMAREYHEVGLPLDEAGEKRVAGEMRSVLKKLLYKEEFR